MDTRSQNGTLAREPFSSPLKTLGNSVQIMVGGSGGVFGTDTTLRLNPLGSPTPFMPSQKGIKRKWSGISDSSGKLAGLPLCLRLGNSSSSSDSKGSSATACTSISSAKELDEESSMDLELDFSLNIGTEKVPSPNAKGSLNLHSKSTGAWPEVDLELSLSSGTVESDITTHGTNFIQSENIAKQNLTVGALHVDNESASLAGQPKHAFPSSSSVQNGLAGYLLNHGVSGSNELTTSKDLSSSVITSPTSMVTFSSGTADSHQQRNGSTKQCQFLGCVKGARGASGLCIAHGGGRRCQRPGCHKGAEGRTAFCKAHGGGRRCEFLGCTKSAEGRTDFCIAHGGGRRCCHEGCTRAARGKSGLCIRHGGGKRCQKDNCTKSAEGLSGLCISHGGGRRCQYPECSKGAQGSTMFCKAHGGGKRCTFLGCTKGAEGSTPFCKGHGGGKRCSFQRGGVCPKSVHGGTLFIFYGGSKGNVVPDCTKECRPILLNAPWWGQKMQI
ncbi:hypothetical protein Leryth_014836 [Lithospermum erythrorhizon]|nr:hypothetical protein Leryth_014836 [Lithospermum erythrorhizon]